MDLNSIKFHFKVCIKSRNKIAIFNRSRSKIRGTTYVYFDANSVLNSNKKYWSSFEIILIKGNNNEDPVMRRNVNVINYGSIVKLKLADDYESEDFVRNYLSYLNCAVTLVLAA